MFRRYQLFCSMSFVIHQKEKQKSLTSLRTSDFSSNLIVRVLALYNVKKVICSLSYFMKSLNPTIPVLHIGVFRRFCAIAYVCIGASPNKVYCYFISSKMLPFFDRFDNSRQIIKDILYYFLIISIVLKIFNYFLNFTLLVF